MTEWQMITANDKEIRKLGSCLFKEHATAKDVEDRVRCIDSLDLKTTLKKEIIEDLVANCWNILYESSYYYNGPVVGYLIKYGCDMVKRIEEMKEELEYDREGNDIF